MSVVFDKLLGEILLHSHIKLVTSDPASGSTGDMIINTTDDGLKIYYAGSWQTLHTLTATQYILLEGGDNLLLETGDIILLES